MANISGTNLAAPVVPFTTDDTYATHVAEYGKGGWHEVATLDLRDAISPFRKEAGMAVYVLEDSTIYILQDDLLTWVKLDLGEEYRCYLLETDELLAMFEDEEESSYEFDGETLKGTVTFDGDTAIVTGTTFNGDIWQL